MRDWLEKQRLKKNFTQEAIAKKIGISRSYYTLIEQGKRVPVMDIDLIRKLSVVLGLSVERIIRLEEKRKMEILLNS